MIERNALLKIMSDEPGTLTVITSVAVPTIDDKVGYETISTYFDNAVPYKNDTADGSFFRPYSWIVTDEEEIYILHVYKNATISKLTIPPKEIPYFEGIRDDYRRSLG